MRGITREFAAKVREANRSGELFRIKDHCQSACTMFLGARNVCIEPSARLLFHAGKTERGTRDMMNSYDCKPRAHIWLRTGSWKAQLFTPYLAAFVAAGGGNATPDSHKSWDGTSRAYRRSSNSPAI
jgi:hypothetical protein